MCFDYNANCFKKKYLFVIYIYIIIKLFSNYIYVGIVDVMRSKIRYKYVQHKLSRTGDD